MTLSPFSFVRQSIYSIYQTARQRLRQWTKPDNHELVLNAAMDLTRSKPDLLLEDILLRHQLIVLKRQVKRPALTWRDRTLFVLMASKLPTWKAALVIVQPDTVLRWHRELFRWVWRRKSRSTRRRGRPPLADEIVALIKQMTKENHIWGAERIRGERRSSGYRSAKAPFRSTSMQCANQGRRSRHGLPFCGITPKRFGPVTFSRPMTSSSERYSCSS